MRNHSSHVVFVLLLPLFSLIPGCISQNRLSPQDPNVILTVRSAVLASGRLDEFDKILFEQKAPVVRIERIDWFITCYWDWELDNKTQINVAGNCAKTAIDANDLFIKVTHNRPVHNR